MDKEYCDCCGVKFDGVSDCGDEYSEENKNNQWINHYDELGGICKFCANMLSADLVDVAQGTRTSYGNFTIFNYKEHPDLIERLKEVNEICFSSISCPRCGGELVEKKANASLFSNETTTVKKCKGCGWC